jgi:dTDP-4-dehydrorhamnose reductase
MLAAARRMPTLRVVADQRGCPTNAEDLAHAVLRIAAALRDGAPGGLYHAAGTGETTWHGFAEAIFDAARPQGWPVPVVEAVTTADWPTPARRPADSRLDCTKLADSFGVRLPAWRPSLDRTIAAIAANMAPV